MKVIDNFLEEEYFNKLSNLVCSTNYEFAWYYGPYYLSTLDNEDDPLQYFFTHLVYLNDVPLSPHYDFCQELLGAIDAKGEGIKSLMRIRANYFPNTKSLHEYSMHTDMEFSHTAAVLSLNTCDGYTKLADGTKVDSVENRIIFFDAGEAHCSTTTSNKKARFNIIVNYL